MSEPRDPAQRIVALLRERQRSEGLSDQQMAVRLGVSKTLWVLTRLGRRRVGMRLLEGAAVAFPDVIKPEEIVALFVPGAPTTDVGAIVADTEDQP